MPPRLESGNLLVVEDDPEMGAVLYRGLTAEKHAVELVSNGIDALISANRVAPHVAVIDVMLPGMNGFEVCRRLRTLYADMGILLLTARSSVDDRVFGLDAGADDYLTKPFAFAELNARVRALLRRDALASSTIVAVGSLRLDSLDHTATVAGTPVSLSPKEFLLLRLLASNVGDLISRDRILDEVWGGLAHLDRNIVDQYLSYLRRKLNQPEASIRITTVRGVGFLLEEA